jgi:hypothetical protein
MDSLYFFNSAAVPSAGAGFKLTQRVEAGKDHFSSYVLRYPVTKSNQVNNH